METLVPPAEQRTVLYDICWETSNSARWIDPAPPSWKFAGDATKIYQVRIRLRAITEPK